MQQKRKESKKKEFGCCFDCKYAYLMQSEKTNPIVSECILSKDREVAKMFMCRSGNFEPIGDKEREIHEMIKAGI